MVASPVDLVMFGIQAAVRLDRQLRHAFAEATLDRPLSLPLPNFPSVPDVATAKDFYELGAGKVFVAAGGPFFHQRVVDLLAKGALSEEERHELLSLAGEHKAILAAQAGTLVAPGSSSGLGNADVLTVLVIRQWSKGQNPNPSLLQHMAGTVINLAAEFLTQMPGVISPGGPKGRALRGFLQAVQGIDFADDGREEIATGLLTATLEAIRDVPELFKGNEKTGVLVESVARGLIDDVKKRVDGAAGDLSKQDEVQGWGQFVLRSLIANAGTTILGEPQKFLGLGGASEGELVKRVGRELLAAVLEEKGVSLKTLLTQESLDRITKACLSLVGEHPELLHLPNAGLQQLIQGTAAALASSATRVGKDFLPEVLRILLEKTAADFERLLPEGWTAPEKNLLIVAAGDLLEHLSAEPGADARWKVTLGSADVIRLVDAALDEVAQNPGWVLDSSGKAAPLLGAATKAVLETLRAKAPPRLGKQTALAILEAGLRATGRRLDFLDVDPSQKRLISLVIDSVLGPVFAPGVDAKATWVLARDSTLQGLVEIAFDQLARRGPSLTHIEKLRARIAHAIQTLALGGAWSLERFSQDLEESLAA